MALFDGKFAGLSKGVAQGEYAFWLGSGISRDRVVGLDGVLAKLIEFLRVRATAMANCGYRLALDKIIDMAAPSADERAAIDLSQPSSTWASLKDILKRLWNQYSAVLSVEIPGEKLDYLLWVGLDFPHTFGAQLPDAEHLAIGMLALEGVLTELATANWDGLLEAAMQELGYDETFYRITVTGEDLRNPAAAAILYKFHGCALRAIADEAGYRPLLVARTAQITGWKSNETFKIVRDQLGALVQRSRTLMIGMSAQDENIKHLFTSMNAQKGWKWTDQPPAIVFSAQELGDDQKNVLIGTYGEADYEAHRNDICEAARLQAYAKPLLLGLLLHVLTAKLEVLAGDAKAANLDQPARDAIAQGIRVLRDRVADAGDADRPALARAIAAGLARARHQLQNGVSAAGVQAYFPLDGEPVHRMKNKLALKSSGQREAAVALGLIGLEEQAANWVSSIDDPADPRAGALRLTSPNASTRLFFAANDDTVTSLLEAGAFDETDNDAVVVCSGRVSERQQRSPSASMRSGAIGPRYVAFGPMLGDAADLNDLRDRFRSEVGL
ncbi:SIR2 family protein [Paraburkholderia kirstenboschensis]|uniref:SIR2 family protein n=1 Tax=Paraburkholderia kirstenboschensis TaxID=1245436 RepID=A0ABZ0ELU8_9BURK|nr:SIR2 family protein [Paraburkholderia kirstenboschensis]WOD18154.1 SIR2 family protein [Paraburkholderia kirstenboschensis]